MNIQISIKVLQESLEQQFNQEVKKQLPYYVSNILLERERKSLKNQSYLLMKQLYLHFQQLKKDQATQFKKDMVRIYDQYLNGGQLFDQLIVEHLIKTLILVDWRFTRNEMESLRVFILKFQQKVKNISDECQMILNIFANQKYDDEDELMMLKEQINIFRSTNQYQFKQTNEFWQWLTSDQINKVICQLHILINGVETYPQGISVSQYNPSLRGIVIRLIGQLANGKHNYLNIHILKVSEKLASQLLLNQFCIFHIMQNQHKINQSDYYIQIDDQSEIHYRNDFQFDNCQGYQAIHHFIQQNQLLYLLRERKTQQVKQITDQYIKEIHKIYLPNDDKPFKFIIKNLSPDQFNSQVITICISGFTSEGEQLYKKWAPIQEKFGGEMFSIEYRCQDIQDMLTFSLEKLVDFGCKQELVRLIASKSLPPLISVLCFLIDILQDNPFNEAFKQAQLTGKYLAQMIANKKIFGTSAINLIGFSLGTLVIQSCLKELDNIYQQQRCKQINDVTFIGGVADLNQMKNMRFHSVGNKINNVYSENDNILKYLLKLQRMNVSPCGLQQLKCIYAKDKINNYDMTSLIDGHLDYEKHLEETLLQIDFDSDFKKYIS